MGGPFSYAGVENGDACYCGNSDDKFIPTDPKECNIPCTGDPSQFCGSSWRLQVYDTEANAVLILSTRNLGLGYPVNIPMIVDFDGR